MPFFIFRPGCGDSTTAGCGACLPRPRLVLPRQGHHQQTKKHLATPPQPHVRKKLEPSVPPGTSRQPSST